MLTPDQIAALRDRAGHITDSINDFLLDDIARRVSEAGQLTSTASYQIWRAQQLGMSQREIKKELQKRLKTSRKEINKLLTQSAEVGYRFDLDKLPTSAAIPFEKNTSLQQIVEAAVQLAQDDFTNITQTLGMVDPYGNALPLQEAYRSCTDFAFNQVVTGATDYNTAIRRATKNLAAQGVRVIDYESGVHTSLEAAVRRNIMGGLGLMQEQISQHNHDELGADGWEISAHACSAPDHEPIQGKQYTDEEYEALNGSLVRRIGTLNCGHVAFPIIMGVNEPQYTPEQLEQFRADNANGVTVDGKHYTGYEATQMQRKLERAIRMQKNRCLVDEATGDKEKLLTDQIKLQRYKQEYSRFSKAAGLRTENERLHVAGFGRGEAARASKATEPKKTPATPKEVVPPTKPAPAATPKPASQAEKNYKDITGKWYPDAKPGSHTVQDLQEVTVNGVTYKVDGHNVVLDYTPHEKEIAELLEREVGGEIFMVPRVNNPQGVSTPDYMFHGKAYDLKTLGKDAGKNTIFNRVKNAKKQARHFIIDVTEAVKLDDQIIDGQLEKIFQDRDTLFVDEVVILRGGKFVKVLKRA